MKKKIILIALMTAILSLSLSLALVSCTDDPDNDTNTDTSTETDTKVPEEELLEGDLAISTTAETVTLGDVFTPRVMIGEEVLSCKWSSADESIATVQGNGNITAHNLGETTITATYGDRSISCKITVVLNDNLPVLQLDSVDGENAQLDLAHALSLNGYVVFNGKEYDDVKLTYTLADQSFGSIINGVFYPAKLGEQNITVSASWRGIPSDFLTKTINVKVVESAIVLVNQSPALSDIDLYTVNEFDGATYLSSTPFDVKISRSGYNYDPRITVADSSIVRYDSAAKTLVAVSAGETDVTISYKQGDISLVKTIKVTVASPLAKYDKKIVNFSALDGDLVDEDGNNILDLYFSGANALSSANQGGVALDVSTGKVLGVETSSEGLTKTTITVVGKQYGYVFEVEGYTKIFDEAKDFNALNITEGGTVLRGYFIVTRDIDFLADSTGFNTACNSAGWDAVLSSSWFAGTFDGQGHTINGYPMHNSTSMFGRVENGTIKDVAFTNIQTTPEGSRFFAHMMGNSAKATVSNVYLSFEKTHSANWSIFGDRECSNLELNNVIIEFKTIGSSAIAHTSGVGFFRANATGNTATYKNVSIIAAAADNGRLLPVAQTNTLSIYAKNDFDSFGFEDMSSVKFDETSNNPIAGEQSPAHKITSCDVSRYDSFDALKGAGVSAVGSWDISSGKPVWTVAQAEEE